MVNFYELLKQICTNVRSFFLHKYVMPETYGKACITGIGRVIIRTRHSREGQCGKHAVHHKHILNNLHEKMSVSEIMGVHKPETDYEQLFEEKQKPRYVIYFFSPPPFCISLSLTSFSRTGWGGEGGGRGGARPPGSATSCIH